MALYGAEITEIIVITTTSVIDSIEYSTFKRSETRQVCRDWTALKIEKECKDENVIRLMRS